MSERDIVFLVRGEEVKGRFVLYCERCMNIPVGQIIYDLKQGWNDITESHLKKIIFTREYDNLYKVSCGQRKGRLEKYFESYAQFNNDPYRIVFFFDLGNNKISDKIDDLEQYRITIKDFFDWLNEEFDGEILTAVKNPENDRVFLYNPDQDSDNKIPTGIEDLLVKPEVYVNNRKPVEKQESQGGGGGASDSIDTGVIFLYAVCLTIFFGVGGSIVGGMIFNKLFSVQPIHVQLYDLFCRLPMTKGVIDLFAEGVNKYDIVAGFIFWVGLLSLIISGVSIYKLAKKGYGLGSLVFFGLLILIGSFFISLLMMWVVLAIIAIVIIGFFIYAFFSSLQH